MIIVSKYYPLIFDVRNLFAKFKGNKNESFKLNIPTTSTKFIHFMLTNLLPLHTVGILNCTLKKIRLVCSQLNKKISYLLIYFLFAGISCIQFDDTRIVSGSSDKTIRVCSIFIHFPLGNMKKNVLLKGIDKRHR